MEGGGQKYEESNSWPRASQEFGASRREIGQQTEPRWDSRGAPGNAAASAAPGALRAAAAGRGGSAEPSRIGLAEQLFSCPLPADPRPRKGRGRSARGSPRTCRRAYLLWTRAPRPPPAERAFCRAPCLSCLSCRCRLFSSRPSRLRPAPRSPLPPPSPRSPPLPPLPPLSAPGAPEAPASLLPAAGTCSREFLGSFRKLLFGLFFFFLYLPASFSTPFLFSSPRFPFFTTTTTNKLQPKNTPLGTHLANTRPRHLSLALGRSLHGPQGAGRPRPQPQPRGGRRHSGPAGRGGQRPGRAGRGGVAAGAAPPAGAARGALRAAEGPRPGSPPAVRVAPAWGRREREAGAVFIRVLTCCRLGTCLSWGFRLTCEVTRSAASAPTAGDAQGMEGLQNLRSRTWWFARRSCPREVSLFSVCLRFYFGTFSWSWSRSHQCSHQQLVR